MDPVGGATEFRIPVAICFLRNSYTDAPEKQLLSDADGYNNDNNNNNQNTLSYRDPLTKISGSEHTLIANACSCDKKVILLFVRTTHAIT